MKITAITSEEFRWPRHVPIRNGKHTYTHAGLGIVRIETDAGLTGIGLGATGMVGHATVATLKHELIGEDPIDVERLWHKMWVPKLMGRRGLTTRAISAIDIGLWDIRAKVAGMPLYKLLGGYRDRVPTYIAGGYYEEGKGLRELAHEMEENVELGARAIKMKVGTIPIATGENEYTRYGFRDLIAHRAAAILNADAKILGGVTEFMKVAALAQAHDLDIAPHGSQDIHVHLVAAIANGLILEFYRDTVDPMWGTVYHHTLRLNEDGTVSPPDVPGIGADPNYDVLAPYRVGR